MTILVAGSAQWDDRGSVMAELAGYEPGGGTHVIHRGQRGADHVVANVAKSKGYSVTTATTDDIVDLLQMHRPDSFLVFGTSWPRCRTALVAAAVAGIRTRLIRG